MNYQLIPSITSLSKSGSTWREKIEEVRTLKLKQVALFVTGLTADERVECYQRLLEVKRDLSFEIPFMHAVSSMSEDEYWFMHETFATKKFNLHPVDQFPLKYPLSPGARSMIYIENSSSTCTLDESDLSGFAGICLDLSHYESLKRTSPQQALKLQKLVRKRGVGANHISGIKNTPHIDEFGRIDFSEHLTNTESTLHYAALLEDFLFADISAIEVENSLSEQIAAINDLLSILSQRNTAIAA